MNVATEKLFLKQCKEFDFVGVTSEVIYSLEKEIPIKSFQALFEKLVFFNESKAFRIIQGGWHICDVVTNYRLDIKYFDQVMMQNKNLSMFRILENSRNVLKEEFILPVAITPNFWTCNCEKYFIRSVYRHRCSECNTDIEDARQRLPFVSELLKEV